MKKTAKTANNTPTYVKVICAILAGIMVFGVATTAIMLIISQLMA